MRASELASVDERLINNGFVTLEEEVKGFITNSPMAQRACFFFFPFFFLLDNGASSS